MSRQFTRPSVRPTEADAQALLLIYQEWLPLPLIRRLFQDAGYRFYQRVLSPLLVLWGFIFQQLNPDHTCDAAWSYLSSDAVRKRFDLTCSVAWPTGCPKDLTAPLNTPWPLT